MEIQLLETSLSTNKLEKQLLLQGHELHRLQGRNRWALVPWHQPGLGARASLGPKSGGTQGGHQSQDWAGAGAGARVGSRIWASAWDRGWG